MYGTVHIKSPAGFYPGRAWFFFRWPVSLQSLSASSYNAESISGVMEPILL